MYSSHSSYLLIKLCIPHDFPSSLSYRAYCSCSLARKPRFLIPTLLWIFCNYILLRVKKWTQMLQPIPRIEAWGLGLQAELGETNKKSISTTLCSRSFFSLSSLTQRKGFSMVLFYAAASSSRLWVQET